METIGRKETIDLPGLDLFDIDAKIDTGARTSSIHCDEVYTTKKGDELLLHFKLLDASHPEYQGIVHTFKEFRRQKVKSSSGHTEERFVIKSSVLVFGKTYITEFTLADRKSMNYPILLGRKFLYKRFAVDVSKRNLSLKRKNEA